MYFIVLKTAFYSLVRSLVLPAKGDEDDKQYVIHNHDIPLVLMPLLEVIISQPGARSAIGDQPHLLAMLVGGHRDTHFGVAVPASKEVGRSRRGSRPGNSLADAIFNILFEWQLRAISAGGANYDGVLLGPASTT